MVVLDGFTGFTPVQNKLLGELMKVCKKVVVTVVMDQREDPFVYRHPYQLFAISKQMVTGLVKIAGEQKTLVEEPVYLYEKPVRRFRENPAMGLLEERLFRYMGKEERQNAGETAPAEEVRADAVSIHAVRNPKEEAEYVASQIRRLVREGGYRYRDMAVIASDMNTYAAHLEKAFDAFGIPEFMDHKKSILLNAFVEYLRSLLAMADEKKQLEPALSRTDR